MDYYQAIYEVRVAADAPTRCYVTAHHTASEIVEHIKGSTKTAQALNYHSLRVIVVRTTKPGLPTGPHSHIADRLLEQTSAITTFITNWVDILPADNFFSRL